MKPQIPEQNNTSSKLSQIPLHYIFLPVIPNPTQYFLSVIIDHNDINLPKYKILIKHFLLNQSVIQDRTQYFLPVILNHSSLVKPTCNPGSH